MTRGGMNSKLHAVCDGLGRPIVMMLTEGQMNDHKGAGLLLPCLPPAKELLADRGYERLVTVDGLPRRKHGGSIRHATPPRRT